MKLHAVLSLVAPLALVVACGSTATIADPDASTTARGSEQTGQTCKLASECYPGVAGGADGGALRGAALCLDRVQDGYCTHLCATDADCCAVPGECKTGLKQVCAPFESTGKMMCFLSCESADVAAGIAAQAPLGGYDGGVLDSGSKEDAYCHAYASAGLGCRSTGGGKNNRKVCLP